MNLRGNKAHGIDSGVIEPTVSQDTTNEERETLMCEQIERIRKQMEALTDGLQELREGQRGVGAKFQVENPDVFGPSNGVTQGEWSHDKKVRLRSDKNIRVEDQLGENQSQLNTEGGICARERVLRQYLNDIE